MKKYSDYNRIYLNILEDTRQDKELENAGVGERGGTTEPAAFVITGLILVLVLLVL